MIIEIAASLGIAVGSGTFGYLVRQTSRLSKLEEHAINHEKLDDVRFGHMREALSACINSVEKLASKLDEFVSLEEPHRNGHNRRRRRRR